MSEKTTRLDLCGVYWSHERGCYSLTVVSDGKTQVFDFPDRSKVYRLAAQAMDQLGKDESGR